MKIVFVCTGNACRSAAAETVLKKMIADNGISEVEVASCGTKVTEGLNREYVMCRIAADHGTHTSRPNTSTAPASTPSNAAAKRL